MKLIPLTQGQFAQVDNWNYDWLMQWKWCAHKNGKTYYAVRAVGPKGKQKEISMHRVIMNTPDGLECDHQDHNGLNCQEYNMRNCTQKQNKKNRRGFGKSKYLGVSYTRKYIMASITTDKQQLYLGLFKTEEDAARAYDRKAIEIHGEFANLNFK